MRGVPQARPGERARRVAESEEMPVDKPSVGIVLPSHRRRDESSRDLAREFLRAAEAAVEAGADTLWVWDHMLRAPVYANAWHDPLVSLGAVASYGLRLGTGVLVAPVRPAVATAMAVATLQSLSGRPMRLGVGTGWNPTEFQAAGVPRERRGAITDEFLDVIGSVFAGERDFEGEFYRYEDLDTGEIGGAPEIWIAGGSRARGGGLLGEQERLKNATIAPGVARRILRHGRWLVRPTAEVDDYRRDLAALAAYDEEVEGGRPAADLDLGVISVVHLAETDDPEEARRVQFRALREFVTDKRPPEYLEQRYLVGSLPEIRQRLETLSAVGMGHIGLYLLGDVPAQVTLAKKHFGDVLDFVPAR